MRYGLLSRKFSSIESKSQDVEERKKAHEERIKYYKLMVYEDADATLLRLFEVRHDSNHAAITADSGYFVICSASWRVRLSWCFRSTF